MYKFNTSHGIFLFILIICIICVIILITKVLFIMNYDGRSNITLQEFK